MKTYFASCLLLLMINSHAQNRVSLPDSMKKYFNYDTLRHFTCTQTPVGIYGLTFSLSERHTVTNVTFSNDSLPVLKHVLVDALQKAIEKTGFRGETGKRYLQMIFYNNYGACINSDTATVHVERIWMEVSNSLSRMIKQVETSFERAIPSEEDYVVLRTVEIAENPNLKKGIPVDRHK